MMKCTKSTKEKRSAAIGNGLIALAGMVAVFGSGALAQTPPVAPTGSAVLAFGVLVGRWARTEGPYLINISAVDETAGLTPVMPIRGRYLFTPQKLPATETRSSYFLNYALPVTAAQLTHSNMMPRATV